MPNMTLQGAVCKIDMTINGRREFVDGLPIKSRKYFLQDFILPQVRDTAARLLDDTMAIVNGRFPTA